MGANEERRWGWNCTDITILSTRIRVVITFGFDLFGSFRCECFYFDIVRVHIDRKIDKQERRELIYRWVEWRQNISLEGFYIGDFDNKCSTECFSRSGQSR